MRIIAVKTLQRIWEKNPSLKAPLTAWYSEVEESDWTSPNDLKAHFGNASILSSKRVVFNVQGNKYRLIVDIEYRLKIVFIVWFGTHGEYDGIDAKNVEYDKTN